MFKKGILIVLDGYGEGKPDKFNAVANAKTPFLDSLKGNISLLKADGEAVGLFAGEMGGSEVGHLTIGSGRIVPSTAKLIRDEILSGKFRQNQVLLKVERLCIMDLADKFQNLINIQEKHLLQQRY